MTAEQTMLEDIQFSLELLKNGRIDEAREYLESINHPKAKEFLAQIDEMVTAPKSPPKQRSTMSDERRQELVRRREEHRQRQSRKAAPVIDETSVSIFEAWMRNMQSAVHKEAWWVVIGIGIVFGLVLLVISKITLVLMLVFGIALAVYLFSGKEITRIDEESGAVLRQYIFNNWVHYQVKTDVPKKIAFERKELSLNYPASFSSFYALTYREERDAAANIIRSAIISLWARGFVEVYQVTINRSIFDLPIEGNPIYTLRLAPHVTNAEVDGVVETHLVKLIRNYHVNNVARLFTRPWQKGPTPYEVTYEFMDKTHYQASQRIINIVRNDPATKRYVVTGRDVYGNKRFTVTADHEEPLREEGLEILRMATGQTPETRAFTTALNNGVVAAVRQRTTAKNN